MYDYTVFIGRFQIPHRAHFEVMTKALRESGTLILAIGSSNVGRSLRNPFSFEQRVMLIEHCGIPEITDAIKAGKLKFVPIEDSVYSDQWWVEQVQRKVRSITGTDANVALIGCEKDHTSFYIRLFPQWGLIEIPAEDLMSATQCRESYYRYGPYDTSFQNMLGSYTAQGVIEALKFIPEFVFRQLQDRFFYVEEYQRHWGKGPFNTVDSVVIKNGHILCIKRAGEDFNGHLWALPGGFIDKSDASPYDASLRELQEETTLDLNGVHKHYAPVTYRSHTFDSPERDDRAHIITHAFCYKLVDRGPLPEVKGTDDAAHAEWVPIVDLRADNMWNDHYFIVRKLIAGL